MYLSRLTYYGDFILSPLLVVILSALAVRALDLSALVLWIGTAALGLCLWTLVEYVVHRSVYHKLDPFQGYHDAHHDDPKALVGAPSVIGLVLIFAVVFLPSLLAGITFACALTSGFLLGYFAYMMVHHAAHHINSKPGTVLYRLRHHHARHHHATEEGNFGVTTAFWDHVFGTALKAQRRA